jgi:hypothetical protein
LSDCLNDRAARRVGLWTGVAFLLLYLYSVGNIVIGPGVDLAAGRATPSASFAYDWTEKMWKPIAPFVWEPIAALYPIRSIALFVSVPNILLSLLLGSLVGLNLTVAIARARLLAATERAEKRGFSRAKNAKYAKAAALRLQENFSWRPWRLGARLLFSAIFVFFVVAFHLRSSAKLFVSFPALITGFACCVPTIVLALGSLAAVFTVAAITIAPYFLPVAAIALLANFIWGLRQFSCALPAAPGQKRTQLYSQ